MPGEDYHTIIVERDGSLSNTKVIRDGVGCDAAGETLRLIQNMPKWKPGMQMVKRLGSSTLCLLHSKYLKSKLTSSLRIKPFCNVHQLIEIVGARAFVCLFRQASYYRLFWCRKEMKS